MTASADTMYEERSKTLAQRAEEERLKFEAEEKARARYGKGDTKGAFVREQEQLGMMGGAIGLSETLQRRAGKGLVKDF
jgi:hypothetical protein